MKRLEEQHGDSPFYIWRHFREEMINSEEEFVEDKEKEFIDLQFQTLFSVLYETWLEGRPVNLSIGGE